MKLHKLTCNLVQAQRLYAEPGSESGSEAGSEATYTVAEAVEHIGSLA